MNPMRRTAAALLGAAIFDVLPQAELFGGGETDTGFFYQFFSGDVLVPETARMVEERMRLLIAERREIREMEMTAYSAREMFLSKGFRAAAELLEDVPPKELVSVIRIGEFCDLADGPFGALQKDGFQITGIESMGDGEYQVEGCAAGSKDELRAFLRKKAEYLRANHLTVGVQRGYWRVFPKGIVWHGAGLKAKRDLVARLEKEFCVGEEVGVETVELLEGMNPHGGYWFFQDVTKNPEGNRGLLEDHCQSTLQQMIYCTEADLGENQTSLLQRIEKTLIILGFPKGEKGSGRALLEWTVEDGLGRLQVIASVHTERLEKRLALRATLYVERILALLLEQIKTG